jgi:hypothetical protein
MLSRSLKQDDKCGFASSSYIHQDLKLLWFSNREGIHGTTLYKWEEPFEGPKVVLPSLIGF